MEIPIALRTYSFRLRVTAKGKYDKELTLNDDKIAWLGAELNSSGTSVLRVLHYKENKIAFRQFMQQVCDHRSNDWERHLYAITPDGFQLASRMLRAHFGVDPVRRR